MQFCSNELESGAVINVTPAVKLLFEEGKHFIGYGLNMKGAWLDCLAQINYYLRECPEKGRAIGKAMRQEILAKHTYEHRGWRLREIVEART